MDLCNQHFNRHGPHVEGFLMDKCKPRAAKKLRRNDWLSVNDVRKVLMHPFVGLFQKTVVQTFR